MHKENVDKSGFEIPDFERPPVELYDDGANDYDVFFALPVQTGFMMVNDRGVERGPYATFDEAHEVGMQTPWVYFWIEEAPMPQTWFNWGRFDKYNEASSEASFLRTFGFETRIQTIYGFQKKSGSFFKK